MSTPISTASSAPERRTVRGLLSVLFAAVLAAALVAIGAPASAHGGPINAEVSQDGVGGVYVSFFYVKDAHPVEALVEATVEGRSSSGEVVGPVPLSSASQGVGIWETEPGTFSAGLWELTVKVAAPAPYVETVELEIALADVVDEDDEAAASGPSPAAASADPVAGVGQWWPLALGIGVVVAAGLVVVLVARRGRTSVRR